MTEAKPREALKTFGSRAAFVVLCAMVIVTTLLFASTTTWALAILQMLTAVLVAAWLADALARRQFVVARNPLPLALVGLILIGALQLLPLGDTRAAALAGDVMLTDDARVMFAKRSRALTLDYYATQLAMFKTFALLIFFTACLTFINSPKRLRNSVRLITIFGLSVAAYGLVQAVLSPDLIYGFRPYGAVVPFGMFINADHFANYMVMAMCLPLGLLMSGAIASEKRLLYGLAVMVMGVALISSGARGAMLALACAVLFLILAAHRANAKKSFSPWVRVAIGGGLTVALLGGVLIFGGEAGLNKLLGTVNAKDPTSGRLTYWAGTLELIKQRPLIGNGLGAFPLAYNRVDNADGTARIEEAHNDYLQLLADAGLLGFTVGAWFVFVLFRRAWRAIGSTDDYRTGVALGALAACVAMLIHAMFDFSMQIAANATLFLLLVTLATQDARIETPNLRRRKKRHRTRTSPSTNMERGQECPPTGNADGSSANWERGHPCPQ